MLIRYGKDCDMRSINRDLSKIAQMVAENERNSLYHWDESLEENLCCRACGCQQRKLVLTIHGKYDFYECENCGTLYLGQNPRYRAMYVDEGDKANGNIYIDDSNWFKRVDMISKPKVDFVLDVCKAENITPKSWIDIGCGGGEILYAISKYTTIDCLGVEADQNERVFAEAKGIRVMDAFLDVNNVDEELAQQLRTKDIVSIFNVLEHMVEPAKVVDYLGKIMKKGSVFVIEVPRHPSVASFANMTCMDKVIYRHINPPFHASIFTEKAIDILFDGKFRMVGKWGFGQGFTDIINNALLISGRPVDEVYTKMLDCSNPIQKILDEAGLSDTMIYVAVKE